MESYLLATKLRIPPQTHQLVERTRLFEALEHGIPGYKLVLLSAPAGYGKTTLLTQWAHASRFPVAWLSLGAEDSDVDRFLRYLLAAWEQAQPSLSESSLGLLLSGIAPESAAVLTEFINTASAELEHVVFVLDDYHLIDDPAVHQALAFLLDHLPPTLHFVLSERGEPPLPLARYRARQELLELHAAELAFSVAETEAFLNHGMRLDLRRDEIVPLHAKLEGWITGLQLVALAHRRPATGTPAPAVSGRQRYIVDYLHDDVLTQLPTETQSFLLQTSILERLSAPLCEAVTGQADGQAMLERLERECLFLVPLDAERAWYRYHRLFAEFLEGELRRLRPAEVAALHRRAARWHRAQHQPEPAFRHAVAGADVELVIELTELYLVAFLFSGDFRLAERWLTSVPDDWYAAYPLLELAQVTLMLFAGAFDGALRRLDEIEARLEAAAADDLSQQRAKVAAFRCAIACFQNDLEQAERYADAALRDLPNDDLVTRADTYQALGETYGRNGYWEEARDCYLKALAFSGDPVGRLRSAHVHGALADLELRRGRLQAAAGYWRQALAIMQERESWGRLPLPVIGWVYIRQGELLYEWNDLPNAWDHVQHGLERAELGGDARTLLAGCLVAGRLKLTAGDAEAAEAYLDRARALLDEASLPEWSGRFERLQLELWLAQDRLRAAVNWADALLREDSPDSRPVDELTQLAIARVLLVKGDVAAGARAQTLLETLLRTAAAEGRVGIQVETLALQAMAHWRRGQQVEAMTALERALRLAEPDSYVRLFADLGLPMARLLQEARSRAVLPDYVATLLAAFGPGLSPDPAERALPEPLTTRELEILELLAAGLTNREIAERLFISPQTVKKHAGSIYGKLGVGSRTQAVARARELDLLG